MSLQTTLLTCHKGVDLHAATALRVMRERLEGGGRLADLRRCEWHCFWDDACPGGTERLLQTGRFYNPNKHRYGVFRLQEAGAPWFAGCGEDLDPRWPGPPSASDGPQLEGLYASLLGGGARAGHSCLDLVSFPRGEEGPLLTGVLWRLVIEGDAQRAAQIGSNLAVARGRTQGLLVNPHMERWSAIVR